MSSFNNVDCVAPQYATFTAEAQAQFDNAVFELMAEAVETLSAARAELVRGHEIWVVTKHDDEAVLKKVMQSFRRKDWNVSRWKNPDDLWMLAFRRCEQTFEEKLATAEEAIVSSIARNLEKALTDAATLRSLSLYHDVKIPLLAILDYSVVPAETPLAEAFILIGKAFSIFKPTLWMSIVSTDPCTITVGRTRDS